MQKLLRVLALVLGVVLIAAACGGDDGSIDVVDARYRLARSDLGAAYMTISNTTSDAVTLTGATAEGIGRVELHESIADDAGTMSMVERTEGFVIGAGETVELRPGGKHLMLFDPTSTEGVTFELDFDGEPVTVSAQFDAAASASIDDMEHSDDDMDDMDEMDDGES